MILHDEKPDVVPNPDRRSLQKLVMALSEEEFKRITEKLSLTPNLTPNEFRNMLLEEEAKQAALTKGQNASSEDGQGEDLAGGRGEAERKHCNNCNKSGHSEDRCWLLHPDLPTKPPCSACGKLGHGEDQCWRVNVKLASAWLQKRLLKQNDAEGKAKSKSNKPQVCCLSVESGGRGLIEFQKDQASSNGIAEESG